MDGRPSTSAPTEARPVPPGLPAGWYLVGRAEDAGTDARAVRLGGDEWVLWRDGSGAPRLHSAWCPHLGAHLGQGGTVRDGRLVCPFHGFAFDGEGACVATGYGTPPPRAARLGARPVLSRDGLLYAWLGADAPGWEPEVLDAAGWSPYRLHGWELRGHPQEISENSVDVGHFAHVHGYRSVETVEAARVEGPCLRAAYRFEKPVGRAWARETIRVAVWGLGLSRVEVDDDWAGARFRLLVMPTPLEADRIRLTIGLSVQDPSLAPRGAWRFLPRWLVRGVIAPVVLRSYGRDVERDFAIWSHKAWLARPALAAGDGPIGLYRAWTRQFYPESP